MEDRALRSPPSSILHLPSSTRRASRRTSMAHTLLAALLVLVTSTSLCAQTPSQSALIEGAKKEGKLVWYTSMAVDTSKPLLDAYLKEYPFIKAELVRLGEEQLVNRILT